MEFKEVIKGLSTPQLWAIRRILVDGVPAQAGTFFPDKQTLDALRKENAELQTLSERRGQLEEAGFSDIFDFNDEEDKAFILRHSDEHWQIFLNHLEAQRAKAEKEVALAEKTKSIKIPALVAEPELSAYEQVRQGLAECKRNNGRKEIE